MKEVAMFPDIFCKKINSDNEQNQQTPSSQLFGSDNMIEVMIVMVVMIVMAALTQQHG